jgi:hypothetical protein
MFSTQPRALPDPTMVSTGSPDALDPVRRDPLRG